MKTTNLFDAVKAECKLTVLAHLKAQLHGDDPADLTQVLTQRLEAIFTQHLGNPIRQAVDVALSNTITAAVNGSLLATLDRVLDHAVDSAIGSAVESLAGAAGSIVEEPAVLTMTAAAQVTSPPVEETVASAPVGEATPATEALLDAEPVADDTAADDGADDVSPELAAEIRRMAGDDRSIRSIARTLKVRERVVRQVLDGNGS
jgi:hypothetical protein